MGEEAPGEPLDTAATPSRPLWQWILLAIAPGLACDALGALSVIAHGREFESLQMLIMLALIGAPALGLIYLIILGRRYVAAGMARSSLGFVVGYAIVNTLLWGAGCSMLLSDLDFR